MMGQPLRNFLEEFGTDDAHADASSRRHWAPQGMSHPIAPDPIDARINEAYSKGLESGREEGRKLAAAEASAIVDGALREADAARSSFSETVASTLADDVQRQLETMHGAFVVRVTDALLPVLSHALQERAVIELAEELRRQSLDQEAVYIEISGPRDLVDRVWQIYAQQRGDNGERQLPPVHLEYGTTTEVRIRCNERLVESRIMEWIGRITEAVG